MSSNLKRHKIADLLADNILYIGDGYRAKNEELGSTGLPFARVSNINNGFHFEDADRFPEENLGQVGNKVSRPYDVVFTSKGTVGRFAFVKPDVPRFVFSPQICFWRVLDAQKIDPRFLYYWMHSREFFLQMTGVKGQTDMADFVSLSDQRQMHIALPLLSQQRAIAHILGTLDDKIELNRKMNETLEAMARALFKSWFVDFDPVRRKISAGDAKDANGANAKTLASSAPLASLALNPAILNLFPDAFEDSELGKIPKGWRVGNLGMVAENPRRGILPEDVSPTTPYIGLEHMPRKSIALTEWGFAEDVTSNKTQFKQGEILFGKLRPYFHKVGIAPVDGVCSTDILVANPSTPTWYGFVLMHLSSEDLIDYTDRLSNGAKMPRTSWDDMARYEIVLSPENVIRKFNEIIFPMTETIIRNVTQSRTLVALRDALLPRLMRGEMRVAGAENFGEQSNA